MQSKYKVIRDFKGYDGLLHFEGEIGVVPNNTQGTAYLGAREVPLQFEGTECIIGVHEDFIALIEGDPFDVTI